MKSIKEKAEEYSFIVINEIIDSDGKVLYTDYSLPKRNAFETGANYVLDAIEECFNPKNDIVKQWGAIATLVEQLKK